ncbi:hypothetical protein P43SY_007092 [Pythium insidiosum]|uniref:ABC transporter domain-containing protein n=1 Tax=Pythium insidiosum TaxID=114742 RepID=A0AAD5M1V4_PYTIN|nr:hypothetical protein P43SY_007092 [Pythium insidiosum]
MDSSRRSHSAISSAVEMNSPECTVDLECWGAATDFHVVRDRHEQPNPATLCWSDLTYTVDVAKSDACPDGKKRILRGVTGRCAPGELTAVMGPSGCGKTTLLDILADRVSTGEIQGLIELNGAPRDVKTFRAVASYVAQEDLLLGSFSVTETLTMAAKISLPTSVTDAEIRERVQSVIDEMGLRVCEHTLSVIDEMGLRVCEHTLVGDIFHKGISGGQKRRLSIGIELLSNPSILLLDEPTSGLDSASTFNVIKFIVKLCQEGKAVVCTIHQPSSLVFEMFTNVAIMSAGQTVYFGPTKQSIEHFTAAGYACPMYANPAEYFIELVNADFEGHADIPKLVTAYAQSGVAKTIATAVEADRHAHAAGNTQALQPVKPSALRQFAVLMVRNSINNIRNPGIYWVRLFMYFMLSFMVGTMYLSTNKDISEEDIVPLLFYVQAFLVFMSVAVLPFFIEQRGVFLRERANSGLNVFSYRGVFLRERANSGLNVFSYVLANFLAALPGIFLIAIISTLLVVLLADLNNFGWFLLNLFLSLVVAESMMHVIGAAVPHYIIGIALGAGIFGMFMMCEGFMVPLPHYIIGIALGAGIFGMFMLCEGFMVPRDSIPDYWIWGYYIAFHSYSFETFGFMVPRDSIPDYWIWGYYIAFHSYSFETFVYKHFAYENTPVAAAILKRLGMENVDAGRDMAILAAFAVFFELVFMFILYKFHTGRR